MPTVYVHRLAEDLRFCAAHKMMMTDFDCCYQHWATDGLNYYVLAKLLWEAERDAWYQELGMSWALNAAHLRCRGL